MDLSKLTAEEITDRVKTALTVMALVPKNDLLRIIPPGRLIVKIGHIGNTKHPRHFFHFHLDDGTMVKQKITTEDPIKAHMAKRFIRYVVQGE